MGSLSSPLMVLVLALLVGAAAGALPRAVDPAVWMERLAARLGPLAPFAVPVLFSAPALLLGWVNAPDPLVTALSVWLLAGCLTLPGPETAAQTETLTGRFVAPLFYYCLLGVPGAVFARAVHATRPQVPWPDRVIGLVPRWLAAGARALAVRWRGGARSTEETPLALDEAWRSARLAAWIAAALAALSLYPRHAFLL